MIAPWTQGCMDVDVCFCKCGVGLGGEREAGDIITHALVLKS